MRVAWAMLCESFVQDKSTNKLSIFNTIEGLRLPALALPPTSSESVTIITQPLNLLALITRSDLDVGERGSARVTLIAPGSNDTVRPEIEVNLVDFTTYRIWFNFQELPLTSSGVYKFLVDCHSEDGDWGEPFEVPLPVTSGPD